MSLILKQELEKITGAYYEEAPEGAQYPYAVSSPRRLSEDSGQQVYALEINVWDKNDFYSRAEKMMDELEKKLHKSHFLTEKMLICTFKGQRQNVPDPDKSIKRVRELFTMRIYEREE